MTKRVLAAATEAASAVRIGRAFGRISAIDGGAFRLEGLQSFATLGDFVEIGGRRVGEIIAIDERSALASPLSDLSGVVVGALASLAPNPPARPCGAWLGKVLNAFGRCFDGTPAPEGAAPRPLAGAPVPTSLRRGIGARVDTGLSAFDTFLPLCRGQRIGLFAGSGVGKSTLLASLARGVDAEVVVCALIGERSREVREFVEETLGPEGRKRSVVIASTSEDPAPVKRRAALLAMTAAEHFRDEGRHVLLLFDSVTRFADAWREIGLSAGETPSLRAYPPSTFRMLSALAERSGPGAGAAGDITAVFTVLVAGSDMDEPVADMMRGILDGHVVLDRAIAERGRFPAIDVRRSVSRALPKCASPEENASLAEARGLIAAYEEASLMIQSGLYARGADPVIDRAITVWPKLDGFVSLPSVNCPEAFARLNAALGR
ncbi:MAG: FliI/YscN family ATPase [Parvularculaceae bacterium]|nr:FliI/YscN family ATPase [Parvularculaceae bacterium]